MKTASCFRPMGFPKFSEEAKWSNPALWKPTHGKTSENEPGMRRVSLND